MGEWDRIELEPEVKIKLIMFLDNSASMRHEWDKTVEGVQEYFAGLQESGNVTYTASLHTFSNKSETVFSDLPLKDIDKDKIGRMKADGVSTALFDALGPELKKLDDDAATYLIVVFTDGKDNSSSTYNSKKIAELRDNLEGKGNFTFVFMGASPDVWEEGRAVVGSAQNFRSFDAVDTKAALGDLTERTRAYSAVMSASARTGSLTRSVSNFYADPVPKDITDLAGGTSTNVVVPSIPESDKISDVIRALENSGIGKGTKRK